MPTTWTTPVVKHNGTPLTPAEREALRSVRVERAVNLVGRATLRLADIGHASSTSGAFKIGTEIDVLEPETAALLFKGKVRSVALEQSTQELPELVVVASEATIQLAAERRPRVHQNTSATAIVKKAVEAAGLTFQGDLGGGAAEYLLQTENDLAYLDELVRTRGGRWWLEPPKTVHVSTRPPVGLAPPTLELGTDLLSFSVQARAAQPDEVTARGWDSDTQQAVVGRKMPDGENGAEASFARTARRDARALRNGKMKVTTNAGGPVTTDEATALAGAIVSSAYSDLVTARGTALANADVAPGELVKVTKAGPASGTYFVTSVDHLYDRRGFHTRFTTGAHRPRGLVDLLGGDGGRTENRVEGVLVGVVTEIDDPRALGRVRVKIPVLNDGKNEVVSAWARVASFDAGNSRGALFLPEIQDEVLVLFEGGNTRKPIVIGSLFGGKNKAPELGKLLAPSKSDVQTRRITSRTGHVVELVDAKPAKDGQVRILHGGNQNTIILAAEDLTISAEGSEISIGNGQGSIVIDKKGAITIEGLSLTVKVRQDVKVEGLNATVKGQVGATVEGGATLSLKGQASASLEGGGLATVKGAMVKIN